MSLYSFCKLAPESKFVRSKMGSNFSLWFELKSQKLIDYLSEP
jgi:hypothetical protein